MGLYDDEYYFPSGQFKKAEDPDGDPIAWKLEASPAHGTVQVDAGELIDMLPMKTISGTTVSRIG